MYKVNFFNKKENYWYTWATVESFSEVVDILTDFIDNKTISAFKIERRVNEKCK